MKHRIYLLLSVCILAALSSCSKDGPVGYPLGHGKFGYNIVIVSADGFNINYVGTGD